MDPSSLSEQQFTGTESHDQRVPVHRKGQTIRGYTAARSQQKFRRPMKFYATAMRALSRSRGLSAPRAFVSFAAVTTFTSACMARPDYSYAIAFYDRLGALARFHETSSNRCYNRRGNVLGQRGRFPTSRKLVVTITAALASS